MPETPAQPKYRVVVARRGQRVDVAVAVDVDGEDEEGVIRRVRDSARREGELVRSRCEQTAAQEQRSHGDAGSSPKNWARYQHTCLCIITTI